MNCKFCEKPTIMVGEFQICDECKTVGFYKKISQEEKKCLILDYLNEIQCKVIEQQDFLHDIEQKYILNKDLTPAEQEIRKNMADFQSIRLQLEAHIQNNSQLRKKNERNLLFRLLILSEWFSMYFGGASK